MSLMKLTVHGDSAVESDEERWVEVMDTLYEDAGLYNRTATLLCGPQNEFNGYFHSCTLSGLPGQCSTLMVYNLPSIKEGYAHKTFTKDILIVAEEMGYTKVMLTVNSSELPTSQGRMPDKIKKWLAAGWEIMTTPFINRRTDMAIYVMEMPVEESS